VGWGRDRRRVAAFSRRPCRVAHLKYLIYRVWVVVVVVVVAAAVH